MDDLYEDLGIGYLVVTDSKGINLYSWRDGETRDDLTEMWGMDEAFEGKEIISTNKGPQGFIICAIHPVYQGNNLKGTVVAGIKIDNQFAKLLARDTGSNIFFGSSSGVIASSVPDGQSFSIDATLVKHSLLDKMPTLIFDQQQKTTRLYAPIALADTHFSLVVDTDASRMYLLLDQSRSRLLLISAAILLIVGTLGSWAATRFTKPLRILRNRAEDVIVDYSSGQGAVWGQGNEVEVLVQAFDQMVGAVRDHVKDKAVAHEQLEKARDELEDRVRERTAKLAETNEELVRAEMSARENERWLQTILESLQIGVMLIDSRTHQIVYANKATSDLVGVPDNILVGAGCHQYICPAEIGNCPVSDRGETTDNSERILITGDGSQIPIIKSVVPVSFKGRSLLLESFIDIRERKKLEEAMKAAKLSAESANRAKSEFLARMSHEIRTPMNGVLGFMRLLQGEAITEKQGNYVRLDLASGESLLNIINDILDFSKIEAGKLTLTAVDFNLNDLTDEVAGFFSEQAQRKGIELLCQVSPDVTTALRGDVLRLRQIMINLIGNAVKFTEQGEVVVRVNTCEAGAGYVLLECTVTDTGIGISPEMQRTIFDAFAQEDSSITRKFGGTGLGLTIARQLTELMGGSIGVTSKMGEGSTFRFTASLAKQAQSTVHLLAKLKDLRVLVVDDNATNRIILSQQLDGWGIESETAADGDQALEMLHRSAAEGRLYNIVLLDRVMPGMNGLELASAIKADKKTGPVHIIMLTSLDAQERAEETLSRGIEVCLNKPVRQSQLYNALLMFVRGASTIVAPTQAASQLPVPGPSFTGRILLVEDNLVNQQLGQILIEQLGCTVTVVNNGREAIDIIAEEAFDLVFMDCQMPEMDGYEATHVIRERESAAGENGKAAHQTIIALTAHAMEDDRRECLAQGMDDYLSKPFGLAQLEKILERWMPTAQKEETGKEERREKQQGTEGEVAILDREMIEMIGAVKPGLLDKILNIYLESSEGLVQDVRVSVGSGNAMNLMKTSHNLKSSTANIGAIKLSKLCQELEAKRRANCMEDTCFLVDALEAEYARVKVAVRRELEILDIGSG